MFRFTLRDLLWLTLLVAISLSVVANLRPMRKLASAAYDSVWGEFEKIVPLSGSDSVPPEW
jgi:hypothetical protein